MKNNIIFKFIAVALCALSLLGSIGSAAGILVLTEGDLYDRTVDELYEENVQLFGQMLANRIALRYAGGELGGSSAGLMDAVLFSSSHPFVNGSYGYILRDAQGNVRAATEVPENAVSSYEFTPTGQYTHLVTLIPEAERFPQTGDDSEASLPVVISGGDWSLTSNIPDEGTMVDYVDFNLLDWDESYNVMVAGVAYYRPDGSVVFRTTSPFGFEDTFAEGVLEGITLLCQGNLIYDCHSSGGVGTVQLDEYGCLVFHSYVFEAAPGETVPETVPEETVIPTEEVVETTEAKPALTISDNIPKDGCEVIGVEVTLTDGTTFREEDPEGLGKIYYTSTGSVCFRSYTINAKPIEERCSAVYVRFWNEETTIFEASGEEALGDFYYNENNRLTFISEPILDRSKAAENTEPASQETTLETTEETVEETTEETAAEPSPAAAAPTEPEETETTESTEATEATEAVTEPEETSPPTEPEETIPETLPEETEPAVTEPVTVNGRPLYEYEVHRTTYYDPERQERMYAEYVFVPLPAYTLELHLTPDALEDSFLYTILRIVRTFRNDLFLILGVSLLVFAITMVYLCCAAGRRPKTDEVRASGLNRIPIDLYLGVVIFGVMALAVGGWYGTIHLLVQDTRVGCAFAVGISFLACLLLVAFGFAFVAQIKTPGGFLWSNSLFGRCCFLLIRFMRWLEKFLGAKFFPFLGKVIRALWRFTCVSVVWCYHKTEKLLLWCGHTIGRVCRWLGALLHRFLSLLPLTWQWLMAGFVIIIVLVLSINGFKNGNDLSLPVGLIFTLALVLYGAHCFGVLWERTRGMGKGDLDSKVDDKLMVGGFKDFAVDLNELAGVVIVAAQKQLKSERMKTELITNVSHDIKTPLTSIINYVDLLQKPHSDEEQAQYLEVLDRQSQRLKKLIEDLMEMSKASTGNMAVEITRLDAVESVNQALGEFADKLTRAQLTPVFRHTEETVAMKADGRLVWRVMSNLLGNAVKYALPGTRLYVDLMTLDGKVIISLKNISREELNMDAEELMERFVRGDGSRNTEGSGLGLNIAKSLMELQKGQLQLLVDGDLFKVTLIFPGA